MKDNFHAEITIIMFILLIICVIITIHIGKVVENRQVEEWNNGYCACGGHWRYEQAIGHASDTTYLYMCEKCGERIEFRKEIVENNG